MLKRLFSAAALCSLVATFAIAQDKPWPGSGASSGGGSGTVTSVAQSFTGGLLSVAGSPVTTSGTLALTVAGTSGGIPYFSSASTWASSAALTANAIVLGGGAGVAPSVLGSLGTTTTVLHGNAAGAPTFGAVSLTADVSGILPGANGGTANGFFAVSGPATSLKTFTFPNASATVLTDNAAVTVAQGGTGIASGTSGGIPYYSGTTSIASSALLTNHAIVLGGGAAAAPKVVGSLGTSTTVLHGAAAGDPTFGAVVLTTDVSGILPSANGGAGTVSGILQANGSGLTAAATIGNGLSYSSPTLSLTNTLNAQVGTTYAMASTDAAKIVTASNASAQAYSIVQATTAGFTSGYGSTISNIGAGTVTLTAATSTFGNGLTTLIISPGQAADIGSDGTNYPFTAMSLPKVVAGGFLANNTGTNNYPISLTATQATAMLNNFTSTLAGLAPLSGGGTTNFLRADGTWAAPAGGSGCTVAGTAGQAVYNNGSTGCLSSAATFTSGGGLTIPVAGAASTPGLTLSGAPFTGGTATTTFPQLYINAGAAVTSFATTGTVLGGNAPSGFTGNFEDFHVNGGASVYKVASTGGITATALDLSGAASQNINMNGTSEIDVAGSSKIGFSGGSILFGGFFASSVTGGAALANATGSITVPTVFPNWSQAGTSGLWTSSAGDTSLIRVSVEKARLTGEGIQYKQATAPVPTGTGSPTIATGSTDEAGEVTSGTSATSVIITFNLTHTNAPFCVVTAQPQISSFAYTLSNTAITITQTATSADKIDYRCTFP